MNPDDYLKYPRLLKFMSETGMTMDETEAYLMKKEEEERKKNPPKETDIAEIKRLYDDCKRRGLL
jgi:DNA-binding transcriptional MerR regulator